MKVIDGIRQLGEENKKLRQSNEEALLALDMALETMNYAVLISEEIVRLSEARQ